MNKEMTIIIGKESMFESIVADTYTTLSLVLCFWFNYQFIDGNNFLDVIIFFGFFVFVINKAGKLAKFTNKEDAINYIKEIKE